MAITLAQAVKSQAINSSDTTIAVPAFDSNVTAGNVLFVIVQSENAGPSHAVSDTQGNTWTELVSRAGNPPFSPDNTAKVSIWWAIAGSSGAITITTKRPDLDEVGGFLNMSGTDRSNIAGTNVQPQGSAGEPWQWPASRRPATEWHPAQRWSSAPNLPREQSCSEILLASERAKHA